ncbi:MAG TPA: divalent metal cation transporter [Candidatus Saccharimonadales bacterium]|nr:divalent metal cation transporter [Candidatus Saccharimonadales bacterium]HSX27478.1 divalent metal cation transporter [Patescibacteria group bacterium]
MSRDKDIIEKIAAAPATVLDATVTKTEHAARAFPNGKTVKKTRQYWNILGPGLTTGASDDDPSGIATYSQTGAQYGFQLLWLSVVTFPLMALVQEMCARIGIVTGRGLAGNIRTHFSKRVLYTCTILLFAANAFNIGADLGAMAKAVQLLRGGANFYLIVIAFALFSLILQIYLPYARYARYLKWLALILLAYVASAILAHLNWGNVLHRSVVPSIHWNKEQIVLICAILGTTISPYLFFWQTSQEIEVEIADGKKTLASRKGSDPKAIREMRLDVWSGMLLSNLVMFFIIAACGAILFPQGITHIQSAAQAAEALRPFAGNSTYFLFAIGIIGTGLLAIPVLAGSSSYAVSESLKWRGGLSSKLKQAHAFYGVLIISVIIGLAINFLGIDPIKALIYSAVANGIVAPLILALIVIISSSKHIMGDWVNRRSTTLFGWAVTTLMVLAGGAAIFSFF